MTEKQEHDEIEDLRQGEGDDEEDKQDEGDEHQDRDDEGEEDAGGFGFDWPVFLGRVAGLLLLGGMLVSAVDLSFNRGLDWLDVLRLSLLPFGAAAALLLVAELLDRYGAQSEKAGRGYVEPYPEQSRRSESISHSEEQNEPDLNPGSPEDPR